jgi:alpha-tubulin suppressor-like RCC1 family protein
VRTNAGKVLTWGWGERGQLGHGTTVSTGDPTPVKIKILNIPSSSCISVQAGYRSTFALLDCRKVLHWGTTGKMIRQLTPIEYSDPDDEIYFSKNSFKPVKVMTTWSRTISICYFLMADMRYMPAGKSPQWLDNQLKLASKQLPAHDSKLTLTR